MSKKKIVRTNIKASLNEVVLTDENVSINAKTVLDEFLKHFNVQEKVEDLSLWQAQQLIPTAIRWWGIEEVLVDELEDDYELLFWEEDYHAERLGIHRRIRKAGLNFE